MLVPSEDGGLPPGPDVLALIANLRRLAATERRKAAKAAVIAVRYEAWTDAGPASGVTGLPAEVRELHRQMAALHRRMEERHLAAAAVHELYVKRMRGWLVGERDRSFWHVFMASVAALLGVGGATATVRGRRPGAVLTVASDPAARAAHELEAALGEGPAAAALAARAPVTVCGAALSARWPLFGPAVTGLGVHSVVAVPLRLPASGLLGALCGYGTADALADGVAASAGRMADALAATMLLTPQRGLFDAADYQPVVHQAAGMTEVHCGCGIDDAEAMLRARAFADGRPVEDVARDVLRGDIRFC